MPTKNPQSKNNQQIKISSPTRRLPRWVWGAFLVLILSILGLLWPFLPEIGYRIFPNRPNLAQYNISPDTTAKLSSDATANPNQPAAKPNNDPNLRKLIIPSIGVDTNILTGPTLDVLNTNEGVWLDDPNYNLPELSNIVLAGHRFQYLPPNTSTFYHLDKLQAGDKILLLWQNQEMVFEVQTSQTVPPTAVEVRNPTNDGSQVLTLYTCTPLGSNTNRLVVQAKLI